MPSRHTARKINRCDPIGVEFGNGVRALRLKGCIFALRRRRAAEQLAGRSLIKTRFNLAAAEGV